MRERLSNVVACTFTVIASVCIGLHAQTATVAPGAPGSPTTSAVRRIPPPLQKKQQRGTREEQDHWSTARSDLPEKMRMASFESDAAKQFVNYLVYLPPSAEKNPKMRYPVIYLLPSLSGDCREVGPIVHRFDAAIRENQCPPVILVGVQGVYGSFYTDAKDGGRPIETVIVQELIARIDNTFPTIPDREHRALEGFSMGGFGAAHLAFKYPELFGVVSIISPLAGPLPFFRADFPSFAEDVWNNDQAYFDENDPFLLAGKNAEKIRGKMQIRIYGGADDRFLVFAQDLHARLDELKIPHEFRVAPGVKHNLSGVVDNLREPFFALWQRAFPKYVPPVEPPAATAP